MADKGSTLLNGTATISQPEVQKPCVRSYPAEPEQKNVKLWTIGGGAALMLFSYVLLTWVPSDWTWEMLRIFGVLLVLMGAFYFPVEAPKPAFVIWWVMMIGECIFFREGDANSNANAYAGNFPTAAYGEALAWIMCLLAVLLLSARVRGFFAQLFKGDFKWNTLFAAMCVVSCAYTPRFSLGAVWAFKISLIVMLLWACSTRMHTLDDTVSFLRFNVYAYVVIILLLMCLAIFSKRKGEGMFKSAMFWGVVGLAVMILAGSKTGVLACVFAGVIFYILQGRLGTAFTFMAAIAALAMILILTTPLGDYMHLYQDRAGAESFSGRTILWKAVIPEIEHKPIQGHGYMASEFIMFQVNAVGWAAPHLHNGFLESLYNSGFVGFTFLMMMMWVIPKNLVKVMRRVPKDEYLYRLATRTLALFFFLAINGFFNSSFGGKCTPPFMSMMALVVVSQKLLEAAPEPLAAWKRMQ